MNSIEIRRKKLLFRLFLLEKHCAQSLLRGDLLIDKTDRKQGKILYKKACKKPSRVLKHRRVEVAGIAFCAKVHCGAAGIYDITDDTVVTFAQNQF